MAAEPLAPNPHTQAEGKKIKKAPAAFGELYGSAIMTHGFRNCRLAELPSGSVGGRH